MRILVWMSETMYGEAIAQLLQERETQSVITLEQDHRADFQTEVVKYQPDLVIFDEVAYKIQSTCIFTTLLVNKQDISIIVINNEDNYMNIFHKHQRVIMEKEDFYASLVTDLH